MKLREGKRVVATSTHLAVSLSNGVWFHVEPRGTVWDRPVIMGATTQRF